MSLRASLTGLAVIAAGLLLLLLFAAPAAAHTRSESHSSWTVHEGKVQVVVSVPEVEARRLGAGGGSPSDGELAGYVGKRLSAQTDGVACRVAEPPRTLAASPGYRRLELSLDCGSGDIRFVSRLFVDLVPTHVHFAQVQTADGRFIEQLFTQDRQEIDLVADHAGALQNASFFEYVWLGLEHIFTGPDHQLFIVGLVLLARRVKDLLFVVTGFTLGHSLTLALAVSGLARPNGAAIDTLVGLTIAVLGAEVLASVTRKSVPIAAGCAGLIALMCAARWAGAPGVPVVVLIGAALFSSCYLVIAGRIQEAGRLRLAVTTVFGLIHGFSFAGSLMEMRLPTGRLAELLLGFNLGVELGQLAVVLAAVAVAALLRRLHWAPSRALVADLGSAALAGMGLYWFVSRGFAP